MPSEEPSAYYRNVTQKRVASWLSDLARQRMFKLFMEVTAPSASDAVLDIGVTCDTTSRESNYFEQRYPYKERITCVGTEDAHHLEARYPGIRFLRILPNRPLPFDDNQFDIVFSNAVVEHVGSTEKQAAFIREACRVGRRVFITTPNRWFPFEHHTTVPLLHYLPKPIYRRIMRLTPLSFWSHEENLNLLSYGEFGGVFPAGYPVRIQRTGIGFGFFLSNLVAYTA